MTHFRQTEASDVFGSKHNGSSGRSMAGRGLLQPSLLLRPERKTLDHCSLNNLLCLFRHPAPFSRSPPPPKIIFALLRRVTDGASALQMLQLISSTSTPACVNPFEEKQINGHRAKRPQQDCRAATQGMAETGNTLSHCPGKCWGKKS